MRIGIPRDYFGEGLEEEVAAAVRSAAEELRTCGAVVEEFDLSLVEYAIPAYYTIAAAEASSNPLSNAFLINAFTFSAFR